MITYLFANPVSDWIDINRNIIRKDVKSVSFQIALDPSLNVDQKSPKNGRITIGKGKKFRYEMGPRTVVSDGKVWKSYDMRTNQIFIQNPDKRLEKILFSWIKIKKLKALPVKKISDGIYKIKLPGRSNDVMSYFNISSHALDSIVMIPHNGFRTKIFNIALSIADSVFLDIGTNFSEIFDMR